MQDEIEKRDVESGRGEGEREGKEKNQVGKKAKSRKIKIRRIT